MDFASTSQAFGEDPSSHEKTRGEEEGSENHAEKPGKRKSKSPRAETEAAESRLEPKKLEPPPKDPEQEDQGHALPPETPADKKPKVYEKAKRKSTRHHSEEEGEAESGFSAVCEEEIPSAPPSTSVSLETPKDRISFQTFAAALEDLCHPPRPVLLPSLRSAPGRCAGGLRGRRGGFEK